MPVERVLLDVASDGARGLEDSEAARRLASCGPNALPQPKPRSAFVVFARQLKSPLIYLLLVAAAIALALGERADASVIVVVVALNSIIGALQEGRAERAVAALARFTEHKARVLRAGRELLVEARELVRGDVMLLEAGDAVAADARLIERAALQVSEAALTGESVAIAKDVREVPTDTPLAERSDMVYAGTHVAAGRAKGVVVATGRSTEIGAIAALAGAATAPKTPLERRVEQLGRYVIIAAGAVFVALVGAGVARGLPLGQMLMIGVSTLVGMVPEGLPVAMTIALAVGVQRMARRNAIVRRLAAVETLGSTTVICSDKTGTLTRNEMMVTAIRLPDGQGVSLSGAGYAPTGELRFDDGRASEASRSLVRELLEAAVLCNDAQLEPSAAAHTAWQAVGDPTEIALLTAARKAGIEPGEVRARCPRVAELPFDASSKLMATGHACPEGSLVVIKGAPEVLIELCGSAQHGALAVPLDEPRRRALRAAADAMAAGALRVLAIARIEGGALDPATGISALLHRPTLLGLIGQADPPRAEVAEAVRACRQAGIRAVVVTGDHKATGHAIARELDIARAGDEAVDGSELEELTDGELDQRIGAIAVFARVHPAQKLRIIEAYQRRADVVAMTGDGVNDAPALVRANVGVAMGITGTEVAKDAAKVILGDDNFATIVAAVEEGRVVYRNIKKAVLLLLSTSAAEVLVLFTAILLGYPPPFSAVQILWNNLVTEGVITINLIMEPAEGDEMRRPPIPPNEPLITRMLLTRMAIMVPSIVGATLGWLIYRHESGVPLPQVQTETFTLLAICEWFNVLNCRSETRSALTLGLMRNPWLLGGLFSGIALQTAVVFWVPLGRVFHTVPIELTEVGMLLLVGSVVLWTEEIRKLLVRVRARPVSSQ